MNSDGQFQSEYSAFFIFGHPHGVLYIYDVRLAHGRNRHGRARLFPGLDEALQRYIEGGPLHIILDVLSEGSDGVKFRVALPMRIGLRPFGLSENR